MTTNKLKIHVLYAHSGDGVPYGCGEIRLLRPLSHSTLENSIEASSGDELPGCDVNVIIVERDWCVSEARLAILKRLKRRGVKVVYEADDDLLNLGAEVGELSPFSVESKMAMREMIRLADAVVVSTDNLARRLSNMNQNLHVIPNALDERLFADSELFVPWKDAGKVIFGYMGTFTHLDDLMSIIQPLRSVLTRYRDRVHFEVVGVGAVDVLKDAFTGLPVSFLNVPSQSVKYENFTAWMQANIRWEFGLAPLVDSLFARSKSDIKFLDYGVQGIPGVFSDVPAYNKTVEHKFNGILASDNKSWELSLESLVLDRQLRVRLAREAHDYVWRERMLKKIAIKWLKVIDQLVSATCGVGGAREGRPAFNS